MVPTVPSTPVIQRGFNNFPLDTHQIYDSLFETPFHPSDEMLIKSYADPATADQFSPVPAARRLSRTSSRNLKENSHCAPRQGLATPFTSRPSSRAGSPPGVGKSAGKRPPHTKSRTLSSSFTKHLAKPTHITYSAATQQTGSFIDSIFSPTVQRPTGVISVHGRSGSIPSASKLLDHIPPEDWLVPAKVLTRSPPSLEDIDLNDYAGEHSSFYLDKPVKMSTPSRRRRTTVTMQNFKPLIVENNRSSGSEPMDLTDPVDAVHEGTIQKVDKHHGWSRPRHRRKTVVHMSSDSIFSSALDFSAYMTEFSLTQAFKRVNQGAELPNAPHGIVADPTAFVDVSSQTALDPAFSPASVSPLAVDTSEFPAGPPATTQASRSAGSIARSITETTRPSLVRRAISLNVSPESRKDDLTVMFDTLGLDGKCLAAYIHLF
jgi:hypothetical protein